MSAAVVPFVPVARTKSRFLDVFVEYLKAERVRFVFGIPGGLLHPFMMAVDADPELELVMPKHEEGAAFMADGYARVSGRLAVCAGTSGPGATNLMTGVACAFADGVPMLVVTGQAASHALGKGAAQETAREGIDIVEMFRPVTKYSAMITSPDTLSHHLRRALRLALTGRPGPVHLNVPVDLWEKPLSGHEDWIDPKRYRPETRMFDRVAVQRAGDLLLSARNPVLLAGSGVATARAEEALRALADLLPARVATTPRAKGLFPEDDPRSLGVMGVAGHRDARETILGDQCDVLFTIGASLSETSTMNWTPKLMPSKGLIQLDVDPDRIGRNYPVDVALVGDAQCILVELVYHLQRRLRAGVQPASCWAEAAPLARGDARYDEPSHRTCETTPLHPARWRAELDAVLPDDAIVFSDIGAHMLFNIQHLCVRRGQRFVINLGFGSMGHGTVAPLGAALAEPSRPVFALVGDGCFTMNGNELLTAAELQIPVIWIVENNNSHGITWHCSRILSRGQNLSVARYRHRLDVAGIARAMGVTATVVDRPGQIQAAVRRALLANAPAVIEVQIDREILPPLGERSRSLAGFIER